jgi:hypothetical protein
MPAHRVFQKNFCSISPTIDSPDFRLKFLENLPNLCAVRQALFAKNSSCSGVKSGKNVGEIDPSSNGLLVLPHSSYIKHLIHGFLVNLFSLGFTPNLVSMLMDDIFRIFLCVRECVCVKWLNLSPSLKQSICGSKQKILSKF